MLACVSPTPKVEGVSPTELMPGDPFVLTGTDLADVVVTLVHDDVEIVVPVAPAETGAMVGEVPDDAPPAIYQVRVERGRVKAREAITLEVWTADSEPPCTKRYALKTETSRTQRKVAFERIFTDRPSTREVLFGDDLVALETTSTPLNDGATCSGLWLHTTKGRFLLADDATRDLTPLAAQLATSLEIPLR